MATPTLQPKLGTRRQNPGRNNPLLIVAVVFVIGTTVTYVVRSKNKQTSLHPAAATAGRQALLIEGKGLLEFDVENNTPIDRVSPEDTKVLEAVWNTAQLAGDGKDGTKAQLAIRSISDLIQKHPNNCDAYVLRATYLLTSGSTDHQRIVSDLTNAIKYHSSGRPQTAYSSIASIYALRAKADFLARDYQQALIDLETAVNSTDDPGEVFNNGGVKPEDDDANPSAFQKKDFETLVAAYPTDYRSHMYLGLFYGTFTTYNERFYSPTIENLNQAKHNNIKSALPDYFLGRVFQRMTFWTEAAARDISDLTGTTGGYKDRMHEKALQHFKLAIELDPTFAPAYAGAAGQLSSLRRYSEAIPFYDKAIALDSKDAGLLNDRGLAKTSLAQYYDAIQDFSDAIELNRAGKRDFLEGTYENRASAYAKVQNYESAISDYSRAIGLKFGSQVFLMSIAQIRAVYPELSDIADDDLLEGLREKYHPAMSAADFAAQYKKNKPFHSFVLAGLYVNRGDAYLAQGNFRKAAREYARAIGNNPGASADRWKTILPNPDTEYSVDTQTLDLSRGNTVSLWLRTKGRKAKTYDIDNYEIDCSGRKLRAVSSARYSLGGNVLAANGEQPWQSIVPDTLGERLYEGTCR